MENKSTIPEDCYMADCCFNYGSKKCNQECDSYKPEDSENYALDILQKELDDLNRSKTKSQVFYRQDKLRLEDHKKHLKSLNPKISSIRLAIRRIKS
jgi:hypothetical protein